MNNSYFSLLQYPKYLNVQTFFHTLLEFEDPHHADLTAEKNISKSCTYDQLSPSVQALLYHLVKIYCNAHFLFSFSFAEILVINEKISLVNSNNSLCQFTKLIYGTNHLPLTRQGMQIFKCQGRAQETKG